MLDNFKCRSRSISWQAVRFYIVRTLYLRTNETRTMLTLFALTPSHTSGKYIAIAALYIIYVEVANVCYFGNITQFWSHMGVKGIKLVSQVFF